MDIINWNLLQTIKIVDYFDILLVACVLYLAIRLIWRNTSRGLVLVLGIIGVAFILSSWFNLIMIKFLLRKAVELGFIALVIIFQPEIRHLIDRLVSRLSGLLPKQEFEMEQSINQLVLACSDLSNSKTGALIIIERVNALTEIIGTGTVINSDISSELLKNLFYNKAPLHDGAVVISNSKIVAAGCVLPLTKKTNLSKDLGMRHRAGIGISEQTDALVIIVSEETGSISVALDGTLKRHLSDDTLLTILKNELIPETKSQITFKEKILKLFVNDEKV